MYDDRTRLAWHESAHAVMAWTLGHAVDVVSIVPTLTWNGVCFSRRNELDEEVWKKTRSPEAPLALQPAAFRSWVEAGILVALAGELAAELWLMRERVSGYVSTCDHREVRRAVREFALTADQEELLERGNDETRESSSDRERAEKLAAALVAEAEVLLYVAWLEASARRIVRDPNFVRLVEALVPLLLEHETVPGDEVERLFDEVQARA